MDTGVQHIPPRLSEFLDEERPLILEAWTQRVRQLSVARSLALPRLLDHLPQLLDAIAAVLRASDDGRQPRELPKLHARDRLERGFDLKEVVSEYTLLRRCVYDLYRHRYGELITLDEVSRFDHAIDEAIREATHDYEQQRARVLGALDRLSVSSAAGSSLHQLLDRLLTVFVESSEAVDTSSILLLEDDGQLRVRASIGVPDEVVHHWAVPFGAGFAGRIAATREPMLLANAAEDPLVTSPFLRSSGVRALYGVPLIVDDELLGVAHMGSRTAFEFSDEDQALFRLLINRAANLIGESLIRLKAERRAAELEAIIEAMSNEVMILDPSMTITQANGPALALLGVGSVEELAASHDELRRRLNVRDADSKRPLGVDELPSTRALCGETVKVDLLLHHCGRDQDVFVRVSAAPIRQNGRSVGAVCVCLDVSDRRALEQERERLLDTLAIERERLQAILRQVPAGVVIADARSGEIMLSNEAAAAIWRTPKGEERTADDRLKRIYWPDGRPMNGDDVPLAGALRGQLVHCEVRIHRFDDSWGACLVSAAPVRSRNGEIVAGVVAFVDITERKSAEDQLRALADNIPQLAWIAEGDGSVTWYNRRWFEFTGTTLDEMRGWGWQKVHHPDHIARVTKKFRQHLATGTVWEDTFPLRGSDGRYRWFLSRAVPIRDDSGRVARWFGTNTDVTEQRRLDEAREQFVAILGHDLRSPLNAVMMTSDMLSQRALEPSLRKAVVRIATSAHRMQAMIADLLDFTRGRLGGGIPIDVGNTDLRVIVRAVVDEIESVHPDKQISVSLDGDTRGVWDGARLGQIVQNLVTNAIQHGTGGIDLRVDGREPDRVSLTVANRGPLIPPELLPHLFEPFRRLAQRDPSGSSLGLGLFIVCEIVRAHHGCVAVRSTKEEGTVFEVKLPRAALAQAQ